MFSVYNSIKVRQEPLETESRALWVLELLIKTTSFELIVIAQKRVGHERD